MCPWLWGLTACGWSIVPALQVVAFCGQEREGEEEGGKG
jgi:hypothetical protein